VALENFFRRWKLAWLIKRQASFFRLNFDFHRAGGLWLWPMLFIFAWSSVMLTGPSMVIYDRMTSAVFDYQSPMKWFQSMPRHSEDRPPKIDWRAAQTTGERLMGEVATQQGFKVEKPLGLAYLYSFGLYSYDAQTNRKFPEYNIVDIYFDGDTGKLYKVNWPTGEHSGNTVSSWGNGVDWRRQPNPTLNQWLAPHPPTPAELFGLSRLL
jgi:hypothetical protein